MLKKSVKRQNNRVKQEKSISKYDCLQFLMCPVQFLVQHVPLDPAGLQLETEPRPRQNANVHRSFRDTTFQSAEQHPPNLQFIMINVQ